ncbi:Putative uncharacterized protein [Taphrina deformans PYCC 5710]|uniref:Nuclear protein Es2 n=1 Tax=Taphrina deformans (strain PYCC 5710 / ATCC 11124 / CBS 356.35 / IMI 108563 / JCM 9778 / NBRC 8474) TaxID=1097556 RepID=R4XEF0_TAPDE|nr:Putative uncharacterized protein [Taphrina deformans PYCC 5710]|eukprot:CCG81747.1 Putative uncharacterized protein [Taphrina deformans PYCC 5710]
MSVVKLDDQQKTLIKKAQSLYVPHKRPAIVLEEDEYIDGLSEIIKRDFFPGLKKPELAEDWSENESHQIPDWSRASAITPGRDPSAEMTQTPQIRRGTERAHSSSRLIPVDKSKVNTAVSLDEYQARYTSEDNASFLDILDTQNLSRRDKYAWHYNDNKIYSENTKRHQKRLEQKQMQEAQNAVKYIDNRKPADGWKVTPKNALMFQPDASHEQESSKSTLAQRKERIAISLAATRLPQDAVNHDSSTTVNTAQTIEDEFEESTVNGYGFIEEPDTPVPEVPRNPFPEPGKVGEQTPNPFKIAETPARDQLHDRLLLKARRASTPKPSSTTTLRRTLATPKFKSSPMLSPAAHRMLGQSSTLRDRLKTPMTKSHLR